MQKSRADLIEISSDYQHSINKTTEVKDLSTLKKCFKSDDNSMEQVCELEHTYLKYDDKQISFYKKSISYVN